MLAEVEAKVDILTQHFFDPPAKPPGFRRPPTLEALPNLRAWERDDSITEGIADQSGFKAIFDKKLDCRLRVLLAKPLQDCSGHDDITQIIGQYDKNPGA